MPLDAFFPRVRSWPGRGTPPAAGIDLLSERLNVDPALVVSFLIAALAGLGAFVGKLVLRYISYLEGQVVVSDKRTETALAAGIAATNATERLADQFAKLNGAS